MTAMNGFQLAGGVGGGSPSWMIKIVVFMGNPPKKMDEKWMIYELPLGNLHISHKMPSYATDLPVNANLLVNQSIDPGKELKVGIVREPRTLLWNTEDGRNPPPKGWLKTYK